MAVQNQNNSASEKKIRVPKKNLPKEYVVTPKSSGGMEHFVGSVFDHWRETMQTMFEGPNGSAKNVSSSTDLEQWQRQADNYFADVRRRWMEIAKFTPISLFNPIAHMGQIGMPSAFDLTEDDDGYVFTCAVPGLAADDLEVEIDGHMLHVSSHKSEAKSEDLNGMMLAGMQAGAFTQAICLPRDAACDAVDATVDKGVLTIRFGKIAEAQCAPKKISVTG